MSDDKENGWVNTIYKEQLVYLVLAEVAGRDPMYYSCLPIDMLFSVLKGQLTTSKFVVKLLLSLFGFENLETACITLK